MQSLGKLDKLQKRLAYQFTDPALLKLALSHRSVDGPHNERLEFLGDAILSFIIAELLYVRFPKAEEGHLSRLRASLVKGETLAEIAHELSLGSYLRLGPGELKSGGARRASILADTLEAIIGAVYLDGDISRCRELVLSWYQERLQNLSLNDAVRDSKSCLQEYLQARALSLPNYEVIKTEGAEHCQTFFVKAEIDDLNLNAEGVGVSRKQAEQEAAKHLLHILTQKKQQDKSS